MKPGQHRNSLYNKSYQALLGWIVGCLLVGCNGAVPVATVPTAPPVVSPPTPLPTPLPAFAADARIAGVDVAAMTAAQAVQALDARLLPLLDRPLTLRVGDETLRFTAEELQLRLPTAELVAEAEALARANESVRVPLRLSYNDRPIREALTRIAQDVEQPGELIVASEPLSRSFTYRPARSLDVEQALAQIDERLRSPQAERNLTLLIANEPPAPPTPEALMAEVQALADEWDGVVGFYLYDAATGRELGLHQHSIFSGASIMKVPIMLQTFISLPKFTPEQQQAVNKMIIDSDNLAANDLLAAIVGGTGTEDALAGVMVVNQTLRDLGLPYTYQSLPYEAGDFLINMLGKEIYKGPPLDGPQPQTEADPYLRTTPLEMGRLMTMIVQCGRGEGELVRRYPERLNAERCGQMIALMRLNKDTTRLVAGLPPDTRVAHKSGWVEDMQADVAYVESPGGDYVMAIYLYRPIDIRINYLADEVAAPVLASFGRLVYSAYNPTPVP